ncbi:MAG: GntR family transcriptional regulator [Pirellulales bacterium]|nr:GntR family transcriptional regulator [Pirellulales bacterium]
MTASQLLDIDLTNAAPGTPKYEALRAHFAEQMDLGILEPGTALPTEKSLSESLKVARSTVRQAMASLEQDGLIQRIQGKGTFVREQIREGLGKGSELFALVVPETRSGFYPSLLHGFEAASQGCQHQAVVCQSENNVDRQANAILQLIDKQVGGVAIVPTTSSQTPPHHIRLLQKNQIPVVYCHRAVEGVAAPLLSLPYQEIGRIAGKSLLDAGHRRAAFFGSHRSSPTDGYLAGLRSVGIEAADHNVWIGRRDGATELEVAEIHDALKAMLDRDDSPTAIFASFDPLAELIYLELTQSLNVRVPEDVSLIGVGGAWRNGAIERRLTSVIVDATVTAKRAVELLDEMRQGTRPLSDAEVIVMAVQLSDGQTVGAPCPGM